METVTERDNDLIYMPSVVREYRQNHLGSGLNPLVSVTIAYRTTTAKPRFRQLSPRVKTATRLIAFRTPRLPRFTFCATAEIET